MNRSVAAKLRATVIAVALLGVSSVSSAQNLYTWTGAEATMGNRINRLPPGAVAGVPDAFPGLFGAGTYSFTLFQYANFTGSTQTFEAGFLGETGGNLPHFSLYLGSFNPANLSLNFLGDGGSSCLGTPCSVPTSLAVNVGAGANVVLVAVTASRAAVAGETFTWTGPDARFFAPNVSTVPEPTTNVLLATGLLALGFVARRRVSHRKSV